jgi:multimeric flavodoxin WrbA
MKITAFNSSPNAERGNTHAIVEAFLQGAGEAGAEVENIFLAGKDIHPCIGCYSCWVKTPGKCIYQDDMQTLFPKILASDMIVFATPVYVDNVTGLMKNFMDRLIPIGDPHFELDEYGECRHVQKYEKPTKMGVISNCGYPEQSHFQVLRLLFRRMARNFHYELSAEIYRGSGGILRSGVAELQPVVDNYKALVKTAGKEVVEQGRISETTMNLLEQPLIRKDDFVTIVNNMWDERLANLVK